MKRFEKITAIILCSALLASCSQTDERENSGETTKKTTETTEETESETTTEATTTTTTETTVAITTGSNAMITSNMMPRVVFLAVICGDVETTNLDIYLLNPPFFNHFLCELHRLN